MLVLAPTLASQIRFGFPFVFIDLPFHQINSSVLILFLIGKVFIGFSIISTRLQHHAHYPKNLCLTVESFVSKSTKHTSYHVMRSFIVITPTFTLWHFNILGMLKSFQIGKMSFGLLSFRLLSFCLCRFAYYIDSPTAILSTMRAHTIRDL